LAKSLLSDAPAAASAAAGSSNSSNSSSSTSASSASSASSDVATEPDIPVDDTSDLLGLESLFKEPPAKPEKPVPLILSEEQIDRIADRAVKKLSAQVIESIAWDVVPEIAEKVVREELKKSK
jgi:hypothetical protein